MSFASRPSVTSALLVAVVAGLLLPAVGAIRRPARSPSTSLSGDLVVDFAPQAAPAARRHALASHGLVEVDRMPGTNFVLARRASGTMPAAASAPGIRSEPAVASAHPVQTLHALDAAQAPDDPLFGRQWDLPAIGIPDAWSESRGSGTVVAVIDTGVAYEDAGDYRRAPDLAGTTFVPGWDFVDGDDRPDDEAVAGLPTHGTHIAGTIAATTGNGLGTAAIAPGAAIMPVRVLKPDRSGTSWAIAQGLRFAVDHGATIANLSLGGPAGSPELADAVAYAASKGVLMVSSSGDEGKDSVDFPAAYPDVVAVGAVRQDLSRPAYSNTGPELDLVAPGGDKTRDSNGDGNDDGIVAQTVFGQQGSFCFCTTEGTSSAAAHVSAIAALVWSKLASGGSAPAPATVRDALLSGALDLGAFGVDDQFGAGLVQAPAALAAATTPHRSSTTEATTPPAAAVHTPVPAPVPAPVASLRPAPAPGAAPATDPVTPEVPRHREAADGDVAERPCLRPALQAMRAAIHDQVLQAVAAAKAQVSPVVATAMGTLVNRRSR